MVNVKDIFSSQANLKGDSYHQTELLGILLKIKKTNKCNLIEAAAMLAEELDIDIDEFCLNCGEKVVEALKADAIENNLLRGYRSKKSSPLELLFN